MEWYLVRLKFKGPIHIGHNEAGISIEGVQSIIHSDALFSMFCHVWTDDPTGKEVIEKIKDGQAPFRFSSTSYYRRNRDGTTTYFLPKPLLPLSSSFNAFARIIKQIDFLDFKQFQSWINGRVKNDNDARIYGIGSSYSDYRSLFVENIRARHASDRLTLASNIYHCGEVFFRENSGLFFIIETNEPKDLIIRSLNQLKYHGIGGERSAGYGAFDYEIEGPLGEDSPFIRLKKGEGNAWCVLSLYYPNEKEKDTITESALAYETVVRKGWSLSYLTKTQVKRKTCRMFSEGSIFKNKPGGAILNLEPDAVKGNPIYRSGLALSVPINI